MRTLTRVTAAATVAVAGALAGSAAAGSDWQVSSAAIVFEPSFVPAGNGAGRGTIGAGVGGPPALLVLAGDGNGAVAATAGDGDRTAGPALLGLAPVAAGLALLVLLLVRTRRSSPAEEGPAPERRAL